MKARGAGVMIYFILISHICEIWNVLLQLKAPLDHMTCASPSTANRGLRVSRSACVLEGEAEAGCFSADFDFKQRREGSNYRQKKQRKVHTSGGDVYLFAVSRGLRGSSVKPVICRTKMFVGANLRC